MSNASGIESAAVVGAGLMGSGIAESLAVAGVPVVLRDVDEVSIGRARDRIESSLARAVAGGKLDAAQAVPARERIELATDLEAIAGVDLVIEAVPESLDLKLEVMQAIDRIVGHDSSDAPRRWNSCLRATRSTPSEPSPSAWSTR